MSSERHGDRFTTNADDFSADAQEQTDKPEDGPGSLTPGRRSYDRINTDTAERLRSIDTGRPIDACSWRAVAAECHVKPGR